MPPSFDAPQLKVFLCQGKVEVLGIVLDSGVPFLVEGVFHGD